MSNLWQEPPQAQRVCPSLLVLQSFSSTLSSGESPGKGQWNFIKLVSPRGINADLNTTHPPLLRRLILLLPSQWPEVIQAMCASSSWPSAPFHLFHMLDTKQNIAQLHRKTFKNKTSTVIQVHLPSYGSIWRYMPAFLLDCTLVSFQNFIDSCESL